MYWIHYEFGQFRVEIQCFASVHTRPWTELACGPASKDPTRITNLKAIVET